jgi:predicted ABC-type ATPase
VPDPVLHLIAGPNGSGKSTLFGHVIGPVTGLPFVNADAIAEDRWPGDAVAHAYEAAAMAAEERERLIATGTSFVTETVFSHTSKIALVETAQQAGYLVTLHVVMVPEELAVARVGVRVCLGGHDVPEEKIRSLYKRLWDHVSRAIGIADESRVYDNAWADDPFRSVAQFRSGTLVGTADWPPWTPAALRAAGRPQPSSSRST